MAEKSGLELRAGLFRNTDKNGNVYYSGKSEAGDEFVMFRNTYWKEGSNKPYFFASSKHVCFGSSFLRPYGYHRRVVQQ